MNTDRRNDLITALSLIQNHPAHSHHDILTITACRPVMTETQLLAHIDTNMASIAHWSDFAGNKRRLANAGAR